MASVSWIEEIYNNTDHHFVMWSTDAEHNGEVHDFDTNAYVGRNDWDEVIHIRPRARLKGRFMGIPWYDKNHYRVIAWTKNPGSYNKDTKPKHGLRLHQATDDELDRIHFIDFRTGRELGDRGIPLPVGAERKFALSIDCEDGSLGCAKDDIQIGLELRESKGNWQTALLEFGGRFAEDYYQFYLEMRSAAGKAMIDAATGIPLVTTKKR